LRPKHRARNGTGNKDRQRMNNDKTASGDGNAVAALHVARQDGIPKYLLLRNALMEAMSDGRWNEGDRLPSEEALVAMTGLSLGTVQRSLRILVDEQRLLRKHGSGTFVAGGVEPMKAPFQHCRFVDDASGEVLPIHSRVVRRRAPKQQGPWSALLPAGPVLCIERLFSINHEFTIYTHLYFNSNRFPKLAEVDVDKLSNINFKDLLAREFHHPLARFTESLAVRVFPDYVCKAIKVPPQTSGGVMEICAYDRQGEGVYFQDLHIPPNARRLAVLP
jgi:GntR family transcriptional regulator